MHHPRGSEGERPCATTSTVHTYHREKPNAEPLRVLEVIIKPLTREHRTPLHKVPMPAPDMSGPGMARRTGKGIRLIVAVARRDTLERPPRSGSARVLTRAGDSALRLSVAFCRTDDLSYFDVVIQEHTRGRVSPNPVIGRLLYLVRDCRRLKLSPTGGGSSMTKRPLSPFVAVAESGQSRLPRFRARSSWQSHEDN